MAYETKPGTGSLFKNDYKKSDSHPGARGTGCCPFCEKEFEVAAWTKTTQRGDKFQSLSFSEPYKKAEGEDQKAAAVNETPKPKDDVDLPF